MELKVNQDNCLGCGICVIACPVNAAISPEKCEECGTCQMFCPVNAIWLE